MAISAAMKSVCFGMEDINETPDVTSIQTHLHSKLEFFKERDKTGYYNHTMMELNNWVLFKTKLMPSRGGS